MTTGNPTIRVAILGDEKDLKRSLDASAGMTSKWSGRIKQAATVATAALGVAVVKLGSDAVKAAIDDEKAQATLANTLEKSAGATNRQVSSVEKWIEAQGRALGITDDELRPAIGRLAQSTGDVTRAQELASLAMDIAAGSGDSLATVAEVLAKAEDGKTRGLIKYGIELKKADGTVKTAAELQAELAAKFRDSAETAANTTAGKFQKFKVRMDELKESIGAKLIPIVTTLAEILTEKVVPVLEASFNWLGRNKPVAIALGVVLGTLAASMAATKAATLAYNAAMSAVAVAKGVATAAVWAFNVAMAANPIGLVVVALAALAAGVVLAYQKFEPFRNAVDGAWQLLQSAFQWVQRNWPLLAAILTGPLGVAVLLVTKHWQTIKDGAASVYNTVKGWFDSVVSFITGLPSRIGAAASGMFDGIRTAFRGAINWMIDRWNGLQFTIPSVGFGPFRSPSFTLGTPDIARLGSGGIVKARSGGMLALLAERGQDEAVVPLPRSGGAGLGGGTSVIVNNPAGSDPDATVRALRRYQRRNSTGLATV